MMNSMYISYPIILSNNTQNIFHIVSYVFKCLICNKSFLISSTEQKGTVNMFDSGRKKWNGVFSMFSLTELIWSWPRIKKIYCKHVLTLLSLKYNVSFSHLDTFILQMLLLTRKESLEKYKWVTFLPQTGTCLKNRIILMLTSSLPNPLCRSKLMYSLRPYILRQPQWTAGRGYSS